MSGRTGRPATSPAPRDLRRILEDERFIGGLGLGALIGAAIAGSTLWSRLRGARSARGTASLDGGTASHEGPTPSG
ncbi:MAG TPA: hypothetical protein VF484_06755 [Candidatus Limnocylindrales bacterium]